MPDAKNKLYYGDNLAVLRDYIADQSVDLIYLDPPFNSRQDYNVLFAEKDGSRSASQITAFKDTWEWNIEAERAFQEVVEQGGRVADAMRAFRTLLGGSDMLAYLAMMAPRLVELRRVLRYSGSLYLHCDSTASHYLKILLDGVFGVASFRNEIVWKRTTAHNDPKRFGRISDRLFYYTKSDERVFNRVFGEYSEAQLSRYKYSDQDGRRYRAENLTAPHYSATRSYEWRGVSPGSNRQWRFKLEQLEQLWQENRILTQKDGRPRKDGLKEYLDDAAGPPLQDIWDDIRMGPTSSERLGYPTQKPEALLDRIIRTSANADSVRLDPFCGCGTTVQVAQKLDRRWIGIDITHLAIGLIKTRLDDTFGTEVRKTYEVIGEPTDVAGAEQLALENKYQFQYWALGLVGARPAEAIKKGADRGIDGRLYFHDDRSGDSKQIIFSVKGGQNVGVSEVRDLIGVIQREKAEIGVYISFAEPTGPMKREAAEAGLYTSADQSKYPRIQLLTIRGLIEGTQRLERPLHVRDVTFRSAPKHRKSSSVTLLLPGLTGEN